MRYIINRLKEPSTWAAMAAAVAVIQPQYTPVIGSIAALIGAFLPEKKPV